jgi:putative membrane protein
VEGPFHYDFRMSLLLRWVLNTLALLLVANVVPNFSYRSWVTLAIAAAVLGLLNAIVRPILWFITLPITVLTLGLFLLVLNAIMLELTAWLVPGFDIHGFGWACVGALVLSVISLVTDRIGRREEE